MRSATAFEEHRGAGRPSAATIVAAAPATPRTWTQPPQARSAVPAPSPQIAVRIRRTPSGLIVAPSAARLGADGEAEAAHGGYSPRDRWPERPAAIMAACAPNSSSAAASCARATTAGGRTRPSPFPAAASPRSARARRWPRWRARRPRRSTSPAAAPCRPHRRPRPHLRLRPVARAAARRRGGLPGRARRDGGRGRRRGPGGRVDRRPRVGSRALARGAHARPARPRRRRGRPARLYLTRTCSHIAVASSAALARAGVSRDMPDPPGGVIDRDPAGEPTGVLRRPPCRSSAA